MSFPPPISAMKLRVSTGTSPNVDIFEQNILPSDISGTTTNSVLITHSNLLDALSSLPLGTTFTSSIVTTYEGFPSNNSISSETLSPFVLNQIIVVKKILTLSNFTVPVKNFGDAPFTLSAPASDSLGSFSYTNSNPAVATISGNVVTIVGGGYSTITVTQAATNNYTSATTTASLVVSPIAPTFGIGGFTVPSKNFGDAPFTLSAPASDSLGSFFYNSSNPAVATISGNMVTIVGGGSSAITATQYATNNYTSRTITASLVVSPIAPTFGIGGFTVPTKNFGDAPFTLQAPTSNSDGAFTYSVVSGTGVVDISNNVVTILSAGITTIRATQSATNNYTSATTTASLVVKGWTQRGLNIDGEAVGDNSGYSVSLSSDGNTVAIGALQNNGSIGLGSAAGHVRVYDWNTPNGWTQRGLDIDGEAENDQSGWSVSLSSDGNTVAIGAPYNNGSGGSFSIFGHVRVYDWNGSSWTKRGLDIDGEAQYDYSGWSVSLSSNGNTVAIGAPYNNGTGSDVGHVRVYDWNGTSWTKRGLDINGEAAGDYSGRSVSLSSDGNTVAIGAPYNNGNGSDSGHVRVFYWNTDITPNEWTKRGLDIDGEAQYDYIGSSVSLDASGNTLAIGAPQNNNTGSDAGHVRVYKWDGSSWTKRGLDIDGEAANDNSGHSVSLSSDGNTVAIGAVGNDGSGSNAGHVRVYDWDESSWTKRGLDIDGEAANDFSGWSVSLSSDGNMVAIGAIGNDGTGSSAGHVSVFRYVQ